MDVCGKASLGDVRGPETGLAMGDGHAVSLTCGGQGVVGMVNPQMGDEVNGVWNRGRVLCVKYLESRAM